MKQYYFLMFLFFGSNSLFGMQPKKPVSFSVGTASQIGIGIGLYGLVNYGHLINTNVWGSKNFDTIALGALGIHGIYHICDAIKSIIKSYRNMQLLDLKSCVLKNDINNAEKLLKRVDINRADDKGETALMLAALSCSYEMVEFLIKNGADINKVDKKGQTTLIYAAKSLRDRSNIIKLLIDKGAAVNKTDTINWSPLMHAIRTTGYYNIEILCNNGASLVYTDKYNNKFLIIDYFAPFIENTLTAQYLKLISLRRGS